MSTGVLLIELNHNFRKARPALETRALEENTNITIIIIIIIIIIVIIIIIMIISPVIINKIILSASCLPTTWLIDMRALQNFASRTLHVAVGAYCL